MMTLTHRIRSLIAPVAGLAMLMTFYACDMLEQDVQPTENSFELAGGELRVLTDGRGYIDLYSLVKTKSKIKLNIASQPRNGTLTEVGTGLLKYIPFKEYQGKDAFLLSIHDANNKLLQTDTVDIIVDQNPANLPCIYSQDDWIYSAGTPIAVNVLANDIICANPSDLVLEIYRPNNSFPPHIGTASVTPDNQIFYMAPNNGQDLQDSVVYKVYRASNPTVVGFATLAITVTGSLNPCQPIINPDSYYLQLGHSSDTLRLGVLMNDYLCGAAPEISVTELPHHSDVIVNSDIILYPYELSESNPTILDSLTYKVCIDQQCYSAKVKIEIF